MFKRRSETAEEKISELKDMEIETCPNGTEWGNCTKNNQPKQTISELRDN